jgi:hypothetical protein
VDPSCLQFMLFLDPLLIMCTEPKEDTTQLGEIEPSSRGRDALKTTGHAELSLINPFIYPIPELHAYLYAQACQTRSNMHQSHSSMHS